MPYLLYSKDYETFLTRLMNIKALYSHVYVVQRRRCLGVKRNFNCLNFISNISLSISYNIYLKERG